MDDRHESSLYLQTQELTSALLADQAFEPEGILESITCDGSCHDFYMMIFSAQRAWNRPKYTHTFATFVKATSRPGGMLSRPLSKSPSGAESHGRQSMADERHLLESHTISWLAAKKKVCLFRFWPEPGKNLDLTTSLEWALSVRARISMWGPYQIRPGFYEKALVQKARLESGAIQYKVWDAGYRPAVASSCIHGVCDIDQEGGLLWTWLRYGESASVRIAVFFLPWMIDPERTHAWVGDRLGLADYPIINRELPVGFLQLNAKKPLARTAAVQAFTA